MCIGPPGGFCAGLPKGEEKYRMEEHEMEQLPAQAEENALLGALLEDGADAPEAEAADAAETEAAWDAPPAPDTDGADAPEAASGILDEGQAEAPDALWEAETPLAQPDAEAAGAPEPPQPGAADAPPPEAARQTLEQAALRAQQQDAEELMRQGVPRSTALQLAAERAQLARERVAIAPLLQRQQAEQEHRAQLKPWREMTKFYPGISHVPESVLQSVLAGETPLNAMRAWENAQLRAELSAQKLRLAAQEAALANRRTAPGSAAGAADAKRDAFLDELFG